MEILITIGKAILWLIGLFVVSEVGSWFYRFFSDERDPLNWQMGQSLVMWGTMILYIIATVIFLILK